MEKRTGWIEVVFSLAAVVAGLAYFYAFHPISAVQRGQYAFAHMTAGQVGAESYAREQGVFPATLDGKAVIAAHQQYFGSVDSGQVRTLPWRAGILNPADDSSDWVFGRVATDQADAIRVAQSAVPGQVVYCPLKSGDRIVDYFVLSKLPDGKLFEGPDHNPLILTHGQFVRFEKSLASIKRK